MVNEHGHLSPGHLAVAILIDRLEFCVNFLLAHVAGQLGEHLVDKLARLVHADPVVAIDIVVVPALVNRLENQNVDEVVVAIDLRVHIAALLHRLLVVVPTNG